MAKPARKDKPVYSWIRRGNVLAPEMAYDLAALDGVANGQRVRLEIREWRNSSRLRAYWAMLNECRASTGMPLSTDSLHALLKLECGLVEVIGLPNGWKVQIPSSIALDRMDEPSMIQFFQEAEAYLARVFGFVPERKVDAA